LPPLVVYPQNANAQSFIYSLKLLNPFIWRTSIA